MHYLVQSRSSLISSNFGVKVVRSTVNRRHLSTYESAFKSSLSSPAEFWGKAAEDVQWFKRYNSVYTPSTSLKSDGWFRGGVTNVCYNALDYHVESGRAEQLAVIWDSPVSKNVEKYTYHQLLEQVKLFAGVLTNNGVQKGDRVVIYNPDIPQTMIAMLACARIGAIHSVVFGGFSSDELAARIEDAKPRIIVSASCGIEPHRIVPYKPLLDHAIDLSSHKPQKCIIYQRPNLEKVKMIEGRDEDWDRLMSKATPHTKCEPLPSDHPLYILYTSGTTGKPKGVVRDTGGSLVALKWSMSNIYGIHPGDVWWSASSLGWVVGHSYINYAPLINGNTTILYEGKPVSTPDAGAFWRVISDYKVKSLFTAPTAIRAIKKEDPEGKLIKKYDLSSFNHLFLAGERADPPTVHWIQNLLKKPVIDHWWMTETGWAITSNFVGLGLFPQKIGSGGKPVPGYNLHVLDDDGKEVPRDTQGNLVVKLPLPPGTFTTLYNNEERFRSSYFTKFPGYFQTGDAGIIDKESNVFIMSRTDDVINVAGHRLSTGHIEEVIASHPSIAECAVFGLNDEIKGQVPLGAIVLKDGAHYDEKKVRDEVVSLVREHLGPVYAFKKVMIVKRLPKTRSGKILRSTMAKIANKEEYKMPATIDDPSILDEITDAVHNQIKNK